MKVDGNPLATSECSVQVDRRVANDIHAIQENLHPGEVLCAHFCGSGTFHTSWSHSRLEWGRKNLGVASLAVSSGTVYACFHTEDTL